MSARPLPVPVNPALLRHADQRRQSLENRIADQITRFAGSMLFVDAERIRQTIVPEDLALPATWWSDFNSRVSEAIARATAMPAPAVAAWT